MSLRRRIVLAATLSALLLIAAVGYVLVAGHRHAAPAAAAGAVDAGPGERILFRSTAPDSYGRVATVGFPPQPERRQEGGDGSGPRTVSGVSCDRVYAAAGSVICLRPDGPLATYQLAVLDSRLGQVQTYPLVGVPNRARVSPSGHLLAWTVFVAGDSYNGGRFSTRVGMINTVTGDTVDTLETFAVFVGGRPYHAADLNFWGVTFADDTRFYATVSTHGRRYLVAGDLAARTVRTLADNVECPSLSPDGTRIAFKSAIGDDPARGWRLSVLDLATMRRTPLAETRSVDDQAAWLGDGQVMYAIRRGPKAADVWTVPADGSGHPALLIPDAESPADLAPALPAPESPTLPAPESPTLPAPESPTLPAPESPTLPAPESPTLPAPESPTLPAPESPTLPAPESPTRSPTRSAPGSPAVSAPIPAVRR